MNTDPGSEPWSRPRPEPWRGATNSGYSMPIAPPAPAPAAAYRRPIPGAVVAGGVAIALIAGLAVGYFAQPDAGAFDTVRKPMAPAPPGAQQGLMIEPGAPQTVAAAVPRPTGKLQVLPPDMAQAARRAAPAPSATAPSAVRDVSDVVADPTPAPYVAPPPLPAQAFPQASYPRMAALSGPCVGAASRAAQMVCSDPDLSAADQAMTRAYRRALRSGSMPPEQVRAEQRDWLAAREDAARRSPRALARIYEQRIDDLNEIADDGPG